MYFNPAFPKMNDTVTVYLKVFNYSLSAITDSTEVSFYVNDPAQGGTVISDVNGRTIFKAPPLPSRGRATISMRFIPNDTLLKRVYVQLDPRNLNTNEVHEENNKGWAYLGYDCNIAEGVIGIEDVMATAENINLKVYPNPSSSDLTLSFTPILPEILSIELYDFYGRKIANIFNNYLSNDPVIIHKELPELAPGLYFVRIHSEKGTDVTTKWIKM